MLLATTIPHEVWRALSFSFGMTWEILWALILGFSLSAMVLEIASTNLVIELGIIMALLLGWQFVLGEFVGGPLMIVLIAVLFRLLLKRRLVDEARSEADKGRP